MIDENTIRKIVREEIERAMPPKDYRGYPIPAYSPQRFSNACPVCHIDFGNGPMGYVCGNASCPNKATAGLTP